MVIPTKKTATVDTRKKGSDRPIFIVGCARSGTTLLQIMLHSHPRIAIPPETRFLMKIYDKRTQFGDLSMPENRAALADSIIDDKKSKFGDLGLDAALIRQMIIDGPPTIGSAMGIIFREYAAKYGKPRWGDKRPNYIRYIDILLKLFPDAQFIHIIRDGRDCIASLKQMPWWKHPYRTGVYKWTQAIKAGNRARKILRADQYYELKYEALVSDPEKELRALCAYLGEEFHSAMLEHHKTTAVAVPARKLKKHHKGTTQQVHTEAVGKWQQQLTAEQIALIETVGAEQLRQYAYPLSEQLPALKKKVKHRYEQCVLKKQKQVKASKRKDAKQARRYNQTVQALLTVGQLDSYQQSIAQGKEQMRGQSAT
ncbi:MAG TPA: sulfotransferase [Gammaproteobacteria bacterium]